MKEGKTLSGFKDKNFLPLTTMDDLFFGGSIKRRRFQKAIQAAGLNMNDFYGYWQENRPYFCYYKGYIFLDIDPLKPDLENLYESIKAVDHQMIAAVRERDYKRFLTIADQRIAADLFRQIFPVIPDEEKYPLYCFLKSEIPEPWFQLPRDFQVQVQRYKGVTSSIPYSDAEGWVNIYTGIKDAGRAAGSGQMWTTDLNIAIKNALDNWKTGEVLSGQVQADHIKHYRTNDPHRWVWVEPHDIKNINRLDFLDMKKINRAVDLSDIKKYYRMYEHQLQEEWFFNPEGIHAVEHARRVLFYVIVLTSLLESGDQERVLLCRMALLHDIGRNTDGFDALHGIVSYEKAQNLNLIVPADDEFHDTMRFIIENHPLTDQGAYKKMPRYHLPEKDRTLDIFHVFKDADALDRVRINDLDPRFLRTPAAPKMMMLAHQLYQAGDFHALNL